MDDRGSKIVFDLFNCCLVRFGNNVLSLTQALDTFNAAVVSPIYFALFTSLTIFASAIMFKVSLIPKLELFAFSICDFVVTYLFIYLFPVFVRIGLVRVQATLFLHSVDL